MTRFIIIGVSGHGSAKGGHANPGCTSYSVLDSLYNYREVAQFYVPLHGGDSGDASRKQRAQAVADRLNAETL